ncbi:MAG: LacI family DNA-binding transcriptional regulator [Clostridiaceae bacterium]|nr:LacI family DNA-binding transcriptional regulator [Clostridiaceae bacterium]
MSQLPNIREIAEKAGVSTATVSRVINHNGRYSRETEERVRKAIAESGYVPNLAAKGLRTNRTQTIGVVVPNILNPYFAKLVFELQNALFEQKYATIICNTNESAELEKELLATLMAHQVSGVVLISGHSAPVSMQAVPTVYLDRRPEDILYSPLNVVIESDNFNGGRLAARELLACGCRSLAVIYACKPDVSQKLRLDGFRQTLVDTARKEIHSTEIILADGSAACIRRTLAETLGSKPGIDGLFCLTDMIALGTMGALQLSHVPVPADICLIGFDDSPLADLWLPPLTTIRQDAGATARLAASQLLGMISGVRPLQQNSVVPVELVRRATTRATEGKGWFE